MSRDTRSTFDYWSRVRVRVSVRVRVMVCLSDTIRAMIRVRVRTGVEFISPIPLSDYCPPGRYDSSLKPVHLF